MNGRMYWFRNPHVGWPLQGAPNNLYPNNVGPKFVQKVFPLNNVNYSFK